MCDANFELHTVSDFGCKDSKAGRGGASPKSFNTCIESQVLVPCLTGEINHKM